MVSVIVPIFNVEEYLDFCVESLVNQTYSNIEIILIDDGSTDSSGIIAEKWSKQDNRIKFFKKENSGLADTRNYGVSHASADWIMFVDLDDFYDPIAVEYFVEIQKAYNVNLVVSELDNVRDHHHVTSNIFSTQILGNIEVVPVCNAIEKMYYGIGTGFSACGKLFMKQSLLDIPFPVGKYFEDAFVLVRHMMHAYSIAFAPLKVYKYYYRESSITKQTFDRRHLDFFEAMSVNRDYLNITFPGNQDVIKALNYRYLTNGIIILNKALISKEEEIYKTNLREIKSLLTQFLFNNNVRASMKFRVILFFISPQIYNVAIVLGQRIRRII